MPSSTGGSRVRIEGLLNPADDTASYLSAFGTSAYSPPWWSSQPREPPRSPSPSHPRHGAHWSNRESSPALTSTSSRCSMSQSRLVTPMASSPEVGTREGCRGRIASTDHDLDISHSCFVRSPPTPPIEEGTRLQDHPAQPSAAPLHPISQTGKPCPCEPCKTARSRMHTSVAQLYKAGITSYLLSAGLAPLGTSANAQLNAFFASLSSADEAESSSANEIPVSQSSPGTPRSQTSPTASALALSKREAHKHKEKTRRDTEKAFFLTLKALTPPSFQPCTVHRHAKNNVEEPARMTTLDRAALVLATQRRVFARLVHEDKVGKDELEIMMAKEVQKGVETVNELMSRSEGYVGELRALGVLNVWLDMDVEGAHLAEETLGVQMDVDLGAPSRTSTGGMGGGGKRAKRKSTGTIGKRRRGV